MATVIQKFGSKLRKIRRAKGVTQEKLGEKAGIDFSYLNSIERGKQNPALKIIAKLARVLKIKLDEFMKLK